MNSEYEKRVGAKIAHLRVRSNLTQEQMSARLQVVNCDVTRSALAKIEVGQRHLYVDELKAISNVLSVSYKEILDD